MIGVKDVIRFDKTAKKKILQYFNKEVTKEGSIVESDTKSRVLSFDGQELHENDFGGIFIGSEIYVKSDLASIIKFLQKTTQHGDTR